MSRAGSNFLRLPQDVSLWSIGRGGARKTRRLITRRAVGGLPPSWPPSGACLNRGTSVPGGLVPLPRVTPHRGCVSADSGGQLCANGWGNTWSLVGFRWYDTLLGHGPQAGTACPGHGHHDLLGLFACGPQLAIPCTEPDLGLPAEGLKRCGELCQTQWQGPTAWGRIPVGPRPFDEGPTRRCMAGLGQAPWLTTWPTGRC